MGKKGQQFQRYSNEFKQKVVLAYVNGSTLDDNCYADLYFDKEKQELGLNWITGRTAQYPFSILTPFERTILTKK